MYIIKRHGKKFNKKVFDSYEKARQYIRKWIRKNSINYKKRVVLHSSSNPMIGDFYFSIVKKTN